MESQRIIEMADLFCGAGGTSTGALAAFEANGYRVRLTAINHWPVAVATHTANHPASRHLCASLDSLNPRELYKPGELDVLWASPECTHHSRARGGKPRSEQLRATAWCVVRWADALRPRLIWVENVMEFEEWGPLTKRGKPAKRGKGKIFKAWTKHRHALVQPIVEVNGDRYALDIRFRMLQPHELAAAQGFPRGYEFAGNKTQRVRQIGNAVPPPFADAFVNVNFPKVVQ